MDREPRAPFGLIALFVSIATFGLATATAIAVAGDRDSTPTPAASDGPVAVSLTELAISPTSISASGSLEVTNDGTMAHDLEVVGTDVGTPMLQPGDSATLDLSSLEPGTYTVICTVPGHEQAGMTGTLTVGTGGDDRTAAGGHGTEITPEEAEEMGQKMLDSIAAFPAETEGLGNEVLEPVEILADGTQRYELTAAITEWEVAPGQVVEAWTYNGMVPGPVFVLDVGDRIQVDLTNELPVMTEIHWHGIELPNEMDGVGGLTQDPVWPGETYTYELELTRAAVAMYHAHSHGDIALPNGLLGAIVVGDVPVATGTTVGGVTLPDPSEISRRIPMVLNDAGAIGLSLNGKSFPATEPIVAELGEWVAIDYYSEGLLIHPMHLHGTDQIVVAKDGHTLDQPYLVDTLNVAPGERYTVLINPTVPGAWVFHCHILTHAEGPDGLFGMVTALIVE